MIGAGALGLRLLAPIGVATRRSRPVPEGGPLPIAVPSGARMRARAVRSVGAVDAPRCVASGRRRD
jgi:hypothetical protein